MPTTLERVLAEASGYLGVPVEQDSWLWRDLGLWGDDFDLGFLSAIRERIPEFVGVSVPVADYLPLEGEINLFGKLVATREIPDLTMRELFAFMQFGEA